MIIAVIDATCAVRKRKPEKKFRLVLEPEFFSGFLFATSQVAFITAMIIFLIIKECTITFTVVNSTSTINMAALNSRSTCYITWPNYHTWHLPIEINRTAQETNNESAEQPFMLIFVQNLKIYIYIYIYINQACQEAWQLGHSWWLVSSFQETRKGRKLWDCPRLLLVTRRFHCCAFRSYCRWWRTFFFTLQWWASFRFFH